jgi:hypothetical protein
MPKAITASPALPPRLEPPALKKENDEKIAN